ncbi:MAG: flagellin [Phycisphaeraceae bacterium]|nr:flagellin [Phycisphaeraceae bacterium]
MTTINSNIAALIAHHGLLRANADLSVRLERISTGLRINRGSDDPAGLVKANRLAMELSGLRAAIDAATRGSAMIAAIDGQLASLADRLETLKALVSEQGDGSPLPPSERQIAIDAELAGIEAIANTATFGGKRLLDGSLAYRTSQLNPARISRLHVHQADMATGALNLTFALTVGAERGVLYAPLNGGSFLAAELTEDVTLEIAGPKGTRVLSFSAGAPSALMVTAINQLRDQTGIEAIITQPSGIPALTFRTIEYGSSQTVSVKALGGTGANWSTVAAIGGPSVNSDSGVDAEGWINGIPWVGNGLQVSLNTPMISLSAVLTEAYGTVTGQSTELVQVRGGGVAFQVGPGSTSNDRVFFGLNPMIPSQLGRVKTLLGTPVVLSDLVSGGQLAVGNGDPTDAVRVVEAAIQEVSIARARLGAIDRTRLQGAIESLQSAIEAATAGRDAIMEADVAEETSALVRAQILSQASISMIGIANQQAESLLRLLGR